MACIKWTLSLPFSLSLLPLSLSTGIVLGSSGHDPLQQQCFIWEKQTTCVTVGFKTIKASSARRLPVILFYKIEAQDC